MTNYQKYMEVCMAKCHPPISKEMVENSSICYHIEELEIAWKKHDWLTLACFFGVDANIEFTYAFFEKRGIEREYDFSDVYIGDY